MRWCLVLQFEVELYTIQRNSRQQLLGYESQVRLSRSLSLTTFYGLDCQENFVDFRGNLSLFH